MTIVDPGSHADRRRRARSARDTVDRAVHLPARRDARSARAATIGPLTTLIDADARRRRRDPPLLPRRARASRDGVTIGPFAYLRPDARAARAARRSARSSRSRTPTSAPGAKVPHLSYIGDADIGERHEPRRRARSPPTTTAATSTARRSASGVTDARRHVVRRAGRRSATTPTPAAGSVITEDVPPGALGDRARAPDATSRATPSAARSRRDERLRHRHRRRPRRTLAGPVSALDPQPVAGHLDRPRVRQAPDAVLGPREPRAGGPDRRQARRRPRRRRRSRRSPTARSTAATRSRSAAPTSSSSSRPAATRATGINAERRADGAAGDDRRGGRRAPRTA